MLSRILVRRFLPLLIGLGIASGAQAGSLHGRVVDGMTGNPIAAATVVVHVLPDSVAVGAVSDGSGNYSVTGIPGGNSLYAVVCSVSGYVGYYGRVDELGAMNLALDLVLQPAASPPPPPSDSSLVTGTVGGAGGGVVCVLMGATVTLRSAGVERQVVTNGEGRFSIRVPVSSYSIQVTASGYRTLQDPHLLLDSGGRTLAAVLQPSQPTQVDPPGGPRAVELRAAFPNPSRGAATVVYALTEASEVELSLHDLAGRAVRTFAAGWRVAGEHRLAISTAGLEPGNYFVRLRTGSRTVTRALSVLR